MAVHDELGQRMKEYEKRNRYYLQKKTPVILRLDMKAGHTFTRGFQKPFDYMLMLAMQETARKLCENIEGVVLSYQQSDEITLILQDYKNLETNAWFDYRTDKLCSIAASMATLYFNREFEKLYLEELGYWGPEVEDIPDYVLAHDLARKRGAMFDCRCFNVPKEEVTNLIYWRQLDATRNSIQMVGQANFSHKTLQNKSCNDIQEMLFQEKNINWNDFSTAEKRGTCCIKVEDQDPRFDIKDGAYPKSKWVVDLDIPIFKGDGRKYIEERINFE